MPTEAKKSGSQTHYEILGLKEDCTSKEVKDAFLSLSKAHHPDLHPNDPSQKEKFVEIYEAYSILSRRERRHIYDSDLRFQERRWNGNGPNGKVETDSPHYTPWRDESLWSMRDKSYPNYDRNAPYYGIKGVKRVSNYWVAGGAVVLMMIGALMHYAAFKHSATFTVTQLDTRDEEFARELFRVRKNAKDNGNDLQLKLFQEKFGWTEDTKKSSRD